MSISSSGERLASPEQLRAALRQFASDRDWDQFHSPKNLAIALSVEAAELLEHFPWTLEADFVRLTPEQLTKVREEIADVLDMVPAGLRGSLPTQRVSPGKLY